MKAFIAHSFDDKDKDVVDKITGFVESAGFQVLTGEKAQNRSIAQKVKDRIRQCEVFVGVFTCDRPLSSSGKRRRLFKRSEVDAYTTSHWVVQESGFALGLEKQMVLLVERGVDGFPELQGDMEVVLFGRDSVECEFVHLLQMIETIKGQMTPAPAATARKSAEAEELGSNEQEKPQGVISEKDGGPFAKLVEAMTVSQDYKEIQKIFKEEVEGTLVDENKLCWNAIILRVSHRLGDSAAFGKLKAMTDVNPNSPDVWQQLGQRYYEMDEFGSACDCFVQAFSLCDVSLPANRELAASYLEQKCRCLAKADRYTDALEELRALLHRREFEDQRHRILLSMAEIARDKGLQEDFLCYGEAALDANPLDTRLRFNVAYCYSELGYDKLAVLHYKKLVQINRDGVAINNLGASYAKLKLPGKSVSSYVMSAGMNKTIAMGNLAHDYLDAGFVQDARAQIEKGQSAAREGQELEARVATAPTEFRII
ncbi:MAG: hypothetical protein NTZ17_02245 [Phycisphaerae bacterium]|nr:hypothetical protein [Phycisphaerae bacterium]